MLSVVTESDSKSSFVGGFEYDSLILYRVFSITLYCVKLWFYDLVVSSLLGRILIYTRVRRQIKIDYALESECTRYIRPISDPADALNNSLRVSHNQPAQPALRRR